MKKIAQPLLCLIILFSIFITVTGQDSINKNAVISGKVIDQKSGEPIIGAIVSAVGTPYGTASDIMGQYRLEIKAGTYTIECRIMSYKTVQLPNVIVGNSDLEINIAMEDASFEGSTLQIFDYKKTNTEAAVLMEMRDAKLVVSGMSSAQIAKGQDRDASQVARRIPGVTIVDNRFVMIRGLASRYNTTMINGIIAPSLESDIRAFSFDIIPSMAMEKFLIYKSGSAEIPGEFAGGVINVVTKNIPDEKTAIDFSYSQGFRTGITGNTFYRAQEVQSDWLGMGGESRALPSTFPSNVRDILNTNDRIILGQQLKNNWKLDSIQTPMDQRMSFTIGKRWKRQDLIIGNYTAVNYSRAYVLQNSERMDYNEFDAANQISDTVFKYNDDIYQLTSQLGFLHNWGVKWKSGNFDFKNFINQNGMQSNTLRNGINIEEGNYRREYSIRYTQRMVLSSQIALQQEVFNRRGTIQLAAGFGTTQRQDPDWKRIRYTKPTDGSDTNYVAYVPFSAQPFFLGRLFMDLNEYVRTYAGQYTAKLWKVKSEDDKEEKWITAKGGFYLENKSRNFSSRNIGYSPASMFNFDYNLSYLPYDQILANENINGQNGFVIDEDTRGADRYEATNQLVAQFFEVNLPLNKLNITAGVRNENNIQKLQSADITGVPIAAKLDSTILLPSLNIAYNYSKKSLIRLAYGKTVNRPEFRELAPFSFYDFENNFIISGNPNLTFTTIKNADLRWEHYPKPNEVISAAVFYKQFTNPIEQYFVPGVGSGGTRSFMPGNALSATSYGLEMDVRKSLQNVIDWPIIKHMTIVANASYILSNIELSAASIETGLNPNRPMVGQSPYIVNLGLYYENDTTGWQFSAMYNVIGPRIAIVGIPGVPEVYEMPRNVIDLSITKNFKSGFGMRLGIQDLLNQENLFLQDANMDGKFNRDNDQVMQRFKRGTYFTFGIQYKFREK
jgi:TonB-dependent receptor